MAGQKFLDMYAGQSVDELIALEKDYRIDSLVLAFEMGIDQKLAKTGGEGLSETELIILAVESYERELNNGGFAQFFYNTPEYVPVIVMSLKKINCLKTAAIVQDAIDALGLSGELTTDAVRQAIDGDDEERDEKLYALDDRAVLYEDNIEVCLFEYIKKNRDNIKLS